MKEGIVKRLNPSYSAECPHISATLHCSLVLMFICCIYKSLVGKSK